MQRSKTSKLYPPSLSFFFDTPCNKFVSNRYPTIFLQTEHTLISSRCPEPYVANSPSGSIFEKCNAFMDASCYKVRIASIERVMAARAVIDYSQANIINIASSLMYQGLSKKFFYIAPALVRPLDFSYQEWSRREYDVGLVWSHPFSPRRQLQLNHLLKNDSVRIKIIQCKPDELSFELMKCRIVLNVHQTDYHHTPEELRILPALFSGCIVISEECALSALVPYRSNVIWSTYEKISFLISKIIDDSSAYYQFYGAQNAIQLYSDINAANVETIDRLLEHLGFSD